MAHEFNFLKEITPEYSLEGQSLKLKLQYFGHLVWRTDSFTKPTGKDPDDTGENWRPKEKREAKDEMVRQHHRLNGHKSEQTPGDSGRQRSQACNSPWGRKVSDMTRHLNSLFTVYSFSSRNSLSLHICFVSWVPVLSLVLCPENLA